MPEANADAIWDSTLSILRRDDTVSQRVMALLTLSRLMAVVADTALLAVRHSPVRLSAEPGTCGG